MHVSKKSLPNKPVKLNFNFWNHFSERKFWRPPLTVMMLLKKKRLKLKLNWMKSLLMKKESPKKILKEKESEKRRDWLKKNSVESKKKKDKHCNKNKLTKDSKKCNILLNGEMKLRNNSITSMTRWNLPN